MTLRPRELVRAFREDVKLRQKLLVVSLVFLVVPFAVLALFVSRRVAGIVEERIRYSADQAFEQAASFLEYRLYNVIKVSHVFLVNQQINDILRRPLAGYDLRSQFVDMQSLTNLFFGYEDGVTIDRVRLYVRDQLDYAQERVNLVGMSAATSTRWHRLLVQSGSTYVWCTSPSLDDGLGDESKTLALARWIFDLDDLRNRVGVLRIDMPKASFEAILAKSSASVDSLTYVETTDGELVAASAPGQLTRFDDWIRRLDAAMPAPGTMVEVADGSRRALVKQRPLAGSDWRMVTVIPVAGIDEQSRSIRDRILVVIFAIAAASYLVAAWMAGSITGRLASIMARMRGAGASGQPGRFPVTRTAAPAGRDEIGELARTYDRMIEELESHIVREERAQRQLKGAELRALQAQINPHFLYNTLDMIKWMSRRGMADEIEDLLTSLATFYRLSLSRGRETIPVRDEIRHVQLYARIQNMRFQGAIDFGVEVEEAALECDILGVTLQPLVENSILHGINERPDKRGRIRVRGARSGTDITLEVEDDGVGIEPWKLASLLDAGDPRGGYGVRNIHERFRIYYGDSYGLSFRSVVGRGTTATVRFSTTPVQESTS